MTESVSGFLAPEENAAIQQRQQDPSSQPGQQPAAPMPPDNLSLAILTVLKLHGPTKLTELPAKVGEGTRMVLSMVTELEGSGKVQVSGHGAEETAELTDEGRGLFPRAL